MLEGKREALGHYTLEAEEATYLGLNASNVVEEYRCR